MIEGGSGDAVKGGASCTGVDVAKAPSLSSNRGGDCTELAGLPLGGVKKCLELHPGVVGKP